MINIITGKICPEKVEWANKLLRCDENYIVADYSLSLITDEVVEDNYFYDIPYFPNDFLNNLHELLIQLYQNKDNQKTSRVIFINIEKTLKNYDIEHAFSRIISNPQILKTTTFILVDNIKTVPKYILEGFECNILEFEKSK